MTATARIEDAREYGYPAGFVIEAFHCWNGGEPTWAVPAWDEWGYGEREGVFATRAEAERALAD